MNSQEMINGSVPQAMSERIMIHIVRDFPQFLQLREEWNALLEVSGSINPFLRHEWLGAWWKGYGEDKELFVVCFKKDEKLIGIAPLMKYTTKLMGMSLEIIGFLANHWTRMDFIIAKEHHACLEKLAALLAEEKKIVVLAQMAETGENFKTLTAVAAEQKMRFVQTPKLNACLSLEGTWEEYLKNQSRNFRQDFRKKLRRLEKLGVVALVQSAPDKSALDKLAQIASQSWQSQSDVSILSQESGRKFYEAIISTWQNAGMLDFSFLEVGGKPAAFMVGLKNKGEYFAFETAYGSDFHVYSPGVILHNLLFERFFGEGIKRFDFGYIAAYKKRWTEEILSTQDVTIFPEGFWGGVFFSMNNLKKMREEKVSGVDKGE